jgi:hypothetical protein
MILDALRGWDVSSCSAGGKAYAFGYALGLTPAALLS